VPLFSGWRRLVPAKAADVNFANSRSAELQAYRGEFKTYLGLSRTAGATGVTGGAG
jgi:hypothetical protein